MSKNPKDQIGNLTPSEKSGTQSPIQQTTNWDNRSRPYSRDQNPNQTSERRNQVSGELNRKPERDTRTDQPGEERTSKSNKHNEGQVENFRKTSFTPDEREFDDNDHPHTYDKPLSKSREE